MSLKTVHIFFVLCTTMLSVLLAIWNYTNWISYGETSSIVYMIVSILCGLVAIIYGKRFLTKFKELSFM
ncbi:MAG: hypothetical protein HN820_00660 [Candidatus Marinimicrobia bacterium]|jgi:uncharacterized membrane protein|nr:hypothetical protein [Candidatus Neomarinimicrobiota bacterium]MBT5955927.1 hypothetical protein [Candidatus Neomarinimicrobiota bacterium]MBT6871212.1 hypothetical protein [Candidatus Neomarinimicrobiota bacterium]MBT7376646.1 hypothetical protein [Candidatus Neomarinimicrobiota bacterium]